MTMGELGNTLVLLEARRNPFELLKELPRLSPTEILGSNEILLP